MTAITQAGRLTVSAPSSASPGPIRRLAAAIHRSIERSHRRRILQAMPDYLLKDIGLSRSDIEAVVDAIVDGREDPTRHPALLRR